MRPQTRVGLAVAGALAGGAAAAAIGNRLWERSTSRAVARLHATSPPSPEEAVSAAGDAGLPNPVARYFAFALPAGQPQISTARVRQAGEFRIGGSTAPWSPFTAVEHFAADPPGFVWDAAIRVARFLTVRVRDRYADGTAAMQARLAALIPVVDQTGRPELNAGALQRYLGEAVWFPTALLPSPRLAWEAIDETSARATLTDAGTTVSLEFEFADNGAITRAYTPARYREVQGKYVPTPWECHYQSYERMGGMLVPEEAEVAWILPERQLPYWHGRIVEIEYK